MPISRRYQPELAPGETSIFGLDFSTVIPRGVGIASGTLTISFITPPGGNPDVAVEGPVQVLDRTLYATVTAGHDAGGVDCQLLWTATDTDGKVWPRTTTVLCAPTS